METNMPTLLGGESGALSQIPGNGQHGPTSAGGDTRGPGL